MPGIRLRQIRMECGVYSLRPSFVMSYMSGTVEEIESALFLFSVNNPCWVVTQAYGHDDMFWYRHLEQLGRNSLVGTTVPMAEQVPVNLVADEHHCDWVGEKHPVVVRSDLFRVEPIASIRNSIILIGYIIFRFALPVRVSETVHRKR